MFGLTNLGIVHTLISLVAVVAGVACFFRDGKIDPRGSMGQVYIWTTVLTCLTGFGIFQHGGFGKPHALGILTLITLFVAFVADRTQVFGRGSRFVSVISYTTTFLFHMIPAFTETFTRLPAEHPLFANADDPGLQKVTGVLVLLYLIGIAVQIRRLRSAGPTIAYAVRQ